MLGDGMECGDCWLMWLRSSLWAGRCCGEHIYPPSCQDFGMPAMEEHHTAEDD